MMCNYAGFGIEGTNRWSLLDITHIDFNDTIYKDYKKNILRILLFLGKQV